MKDLLLFFQYKLAQRSKELSFTRPGDCRPGIYGCIEQTAAKKYVLLPVSSFWMKIKYYRLLNLPDKRQTQGENQRWISKLYLLFLWTFNPGIQRITIIDTITCPKFFLTPESFVFPSSCPSLGLKNTLGKISFNQLAYEQFYRLRSFIEHTPQSYTAQKTAGEDRGLF